MSHDQDPYRGLPSLSRLETDLERSEAHLDRGWASRHLRLIGGAGAALAIGLAASPVGPAFGGGGPVERAVEARAFEFAKVETGVPASQAQSIQVEPPRVDQASQSLAGAKVSDIRVERIESPQTARELRARARPFLRAQARPLPCKATPDRLNCGRIRVEPAR